MFRAPYIFISKYHCIYCANYTRGILIPLRPSPEHLNANHALWKPTDRIHLNAAFNSACHIITVPAINIRAGDSQPRIRGGVWFRMNISYRPPLFVERPLMLTRRMREILKRYLRFSLIRLRTDSAINIVCDG